MEALQRIVNAFWETGGGHVLAGQEWQRWARGSASGVTQQLVMLQAAVWGPPIGGLKKARVRLRREGIGGGISDPRPVDRPLVALSLIVRGK